MIHHRDSEYYAAVVVEDDKEEVVLKLVSKLLKDKALTPEATLPTSLIPGIPAGPLPEVPGQTVAAISGVGK